MSHADEPSSPGDAGLSLGIGLKKLGIGERERIQSERGDAQFQTERWGAGVF